MAPKPSGAVAYKQFASNLKQTGPGTECPPGLAALIHPEQGLAVPVGYVQSISSNQIIGGILESASGTAGGGVLHGNSRLMCTVCCVRFAVCLSTITRGDLKSSIRHGPVHKRWSLRNFWRTGFLGQNNHTSWPSAKTACLDRSS